jgi:hypothetical protein
LEFGVFKVGECPSPLPPSLPPSLPLYLLNEGVEGRRKGKNGRKEKG